MVIAKGFKLFFRGRGSTGPLPEFPVITPFCLFPVVAGDVEKLSSILELEVHGSCSSMTQLL